MTAAEYLGLDYNIPTVQALRVLELSVAIALLLTPQRVTEFLKVLDIDLNTIRGKQVPKGLRAILG